MRDEIEWKWIDCYARVFELCGVSRGVPVAVLSESQSRQAHVKLSELALQRIGARVFQVVVPTPPLSAPVAVRSTGASHAIGGLEPVIRALSSAFMVVDVTVEGLLHAPELPAITASGTRLLYISNEHPELLERLMPMPDLKEKVKTGISLLRAARQMTVRSAAGTDLVIDVSGARVGGSWGLCDEPGKVAYWPGGGVNCYPMAGAVNGTVVMAPGDINLTFKRYLETPIRLKIERDFIVSIDGEGTDAELMRSYFDAWQDKNAYATAHLGWGMNARARRDAMTMYDRADINGTEQRISAGNFLFSTGANQHANRFTLGHFDLPIHHCDVALDGRAIIERGKLLPPLA